MVKNNKNTMASSSTASLRKSSGQVKTPGGVVSSSAANSSSSSSTGSFSSALSGEKIQGQAMNLPYRMGPENTNIKTEPQIQGPPIQSPIEWGYSPTPPTYPLTYMGGTNSSSSTRAVSGPPQLSAKAKVQAIPSLSASAGATERSSPKCGLEGYLPAMDSIERTPPTTLKEVRAELQKTFPDTSEGNPQGQTLFGGFEATRKAERESSELVQLKREMASQQEELIRVRRLTEGLVRDRENSATESLINQTRPKKLNFSTQAENSYFGNGRPTLPKLDPSTQPENLLFGNLRTKFPKLDPSTQPKNLYFGNGHATFPKLDPSTQPKNIFFGVTNEGESYDKLRNIIMGDKPAEAQDNSEPSQKQPLTPATTQPRDSEPSQKQPLATTQPRALPFGVTSELYNPESFAELNNRLKTGSRLSAAISTSLANKADFRNRWSSMNTALPKQYATHDFVKLAASSPTKTSPPSPLKFNTALPSSSAPPQTFAPTESLTDFYNKRFESLGAEAKELILKAQKNLVSPQQKPSDPANYTKPFDPADYTKPFCEFLTENPTVFHAVDYFADKLKQAGFEKLSERDDWTERLVNGGKYFVERNDSSLIAFSVGESYKSGNGVAMIAGHVDALAARLKPVSTKKTKAGYVQLGVAPYAGALNATWWDRDLGIGGRVLIKDEKTGKITSKLVKLAWPIARIPTLAPHFGVGMMGDQNAETQTVPIIGLDNSDLSSSSKEDSEWKASSLLGGEGTFAATQPPKLLKAIAGELGVQNYNSIVNWELELFDTQPAQVGGIEKEFIFAGRVDDKLCSWAAMEALLAASENPSTDASIINLVGVFDDEEIGSLLRQGARGNFLPGVIGRISEAFSSSSKGSSSNILSKTYANSFLLSADVTHAVNPNFLEKYLENHAPRLNVGVVVSADSNGHMTTDSVSTAVLQRIAEKSDSVLQLFMIRNDSRSGGTVGPMLSSAMGVRAIDVGIPQLSMHSIRATTGSLDPGLGIKLFKGFFEGFEDVDKEFE